MTQDLELGGEEQAIWTGSPSPIRFAMEALPTVQLGSFWLIGGVLLSLLAFQVGAAADERWPCLLPLLASLVGLGMLAVFPIRYANAKQLIYCITNSRAIVYNRSAGVLETEFRFDEFSNPSVLLRGDGTCDIVFAVNERCPTSDRTELEDAASIVRHGLIGIEDGAAAKEALYSIASAEAETDGSGR